MTVNKFCNILNTGQIDSYYIGNMDSNCYYTYYEDIDKYSEPCIYLLFCGDYGCAYVGQSYNVKKRIETHKRHLMFDACIIIPLDKSHDLNKCEQYYIDLLNPTLNYNAFVRFEKQHSGGAMRYQDVKKICDYICPEPWWQTGRFITETNEYRDNSKMEISSI